jgi:hypothetical protein
MFHTFVLMGTEVLFGCMLLVSMVACVFLCMKWVVSNFGPFM